MTVVTWRVRDHPCDNPDQQISRISRSMIKRRNVVGLDVLGFNSRIALLIVLIC